MPEALCMDTSRKDYKIIIIFIILALLLGSMLGFAAGSYTTIKAVAGIGGSFIDEDLIKQAIFQYQNNIGACFPAKNLTDEIL